MSEQNGPSQEEIEDQEAQEAEEALEREEAERIRAAEEAQHARRQKLGTRQASVLATCVSALDALGDGTTIDDEAWVDQARDRVLRALRANFFDKPQPAFVPFIEALQENLPSIVDAISQMYTPPIVERASPVGPPPPPTMLRVGQMVMTNLGVMEVVMMPGGGLGLARPSVSTAPPAHYTATADGRVAPPPMTDTERYVAEEIARMVEEALVNGDEPQEFVERISNGNVPSAILRQVCVKRDHEILASVLAVAPSSAASTPAGREFLVGSLHALRVKLYPSPAV